MSALRLRVNWDAQSRSFDLRPGSSIRLGRNKAMDLVLDDPSLSSLHLSVHFTGEDVWVKDEGSSNGSFRLPANTRFEEAKFSPRYPDPVELRLGRVLVSLEWEPASLESLPVEATELSAPTSHTLPSAKGDELTQGRVDPIPQPVLRKEASAPRVTPPKEKPSVSPRAYQWTARWIVIGLAALVTAGTQHFLFRESSGALWKLDALAWRQGVYADALILWWEFWANRTLGVLALVFGPGLFAAWWIKKFEARLILKLREWNFSAPRSLGLLAVFCSVLALGWALWIGFVYGQGPAQWQASLGLRQWIQSGEKSGDSLKQLGAPLRGSSFYFRELFLHNRARVVAECGGQGPDAEWDKKRVCLMLLFASMAEAVEQARPVILRVPAARAAVLSSLDGILRVMRVEGRDSALLPFFLNALAQLGLQSERDDLHRIVFMSRLDADQIQSLLVELRFQIEKDLLSSQKNSVPPGMTLYVRSPLEEGI